MLIFTLAASLVVAFIMNPVFAVDFMNHPEEEGTKSRAAIFKKPGFWIAVVFGILFDLAHITFLGNLLLFFVILVILNKYIFEGLVHGFQNRVLPWIMGHYEGLLRWALKGWRPAWLLFGTFLLLIFSFVLFGMRNVQVVFFPKGDPNQIYVYLKLPVGTNVDYTDSVTRVLESRVYNVLGMGDGTKSNPIVESVIANVAIGANDPTSGDQSTHPELGRIQVSFVEYAKRHGVSTVAIPGFDPACHERYPGIGDHRRPVKITDRPPTRP